MLNLKVCVCGYFDVVCEWREQEGWGGRERWKQSVFSRAEKAIMMQAVANTFVYKCVQLCRVLCAGKMHLKKNRSTDAQWQ